MNVSCVMNIYEYITLNIIKYTVYISYIIYNYVVYNYSCKYNKFTNIINLHVIM